MGFTALAINPTLTRSIQTEVSHSQIQCLTGRNYVSRVFFSLVTTRFVCKSTVNFVSAANLIWERLCSHLTALADKHPDQDIWMCSFWEEKDSIISMDTYDTIALAQYCAYHEKGALQAIPTMCVFTIKLNKMMNSHCAKSCIVVLGNSKDRIWSKPDKYTPILHPDTIRLIVSMAIERQCTLQQGDCKNAFCQRILPLNEITIVTPPLVIQMLRRMNIGF
jgi:hypothetical protein